MNKNLVLVFVVLFSASCSSVRKSGMQEDTLVQTRKYVGTFIDYRQTPPQKLGEPNIIWIKTNMENVYGKLSAYSRECRFKEGDRLFVRKIYYTPGGISGYWVYQIESSDEAINYKLSEYQYDIKKSVREMF